MKHNRSSLGNKNIQSLNAKITALKQNTTPIIQVSSVKGNPPARTRTRDQWIQRTIRISQSITTGTNITNGSLVTELGGTDVQAMKVRGVRVWNATGPAKTTNYVFVESANVLTTSGIRCEAQDYGSGSQLAGVSLKFPGTLQKSNSASNLQATVVLFVTASAVDTSFDAQTIVMDWDVLVNMSADENP